MQICRRGFLATSAAGLASCAIPRSGSTAGPAPTPRPGGFDAWIEVSAEALRENARQLRRLTGRPIVAVVKNDAYGLGLTTVGPILDRCPEIVGFGVVKAQESLALREAGVSKPILLMGSCSTEEAVEIARRDVQLSLFTDDAAHRLGLVSEKLGRPVEAQIYLDTGLGRLGMPTHRARPWLEQLVARDDLRLRGTFMTFTEESDFDVEQLRRLQELASWARERQLPLGPLHAATSNAVYSFPASHLDQIRPGLSLYGAYPVSMEQASEKAALRCAFRLRAPILRLEQLRPGDSAGYGRRFIADRDTWLATLPVGHADGYSRKSADGARVWIGGRARPVVGSVSASHCLVDLGPERFAERGEAVTLLGPDHLEVHPNTVASDAKISVYDVLMHLSSRLPKVVV